MVLSTVEDQMTHSVIGLWCLYMHLHTCIYFHGMIYNLCARLVAPCGTVSPEFQYLSCSFVAGTDIMCNTVLYPDTLPYSHNTKKCEAVFHYLCIFFHPFCFEIACICPTYVMCPLHMNLSSADIIEK